MKPTFLRTFSLRTLLVVLTLCGIGLSVVARVAAERRRQDRLLAEVVRMAEQDGAIVHLISRTPDRPRETLMFMHGNISKGTAAALCEAERIIKLDANRVFSEDVQQCLSSSFERGNNTAWVRKTANSTIPAGR